MYQRGAPSIAEQINQPVEKAQEIIDDFYKNFPKVKDYVESSISFAKKHGYVEDFWGRRRHLPDILLPKYSVTQINNSNTNFNPLLGCSGEYNNSNNPLIKKYIDSLSTIKYSKEYTALKAAAAAEGIVIEDNGGKIAQAERQCVNARIQGGAATLTKIAMIKVHNDPELKKLKFTLLLAVHDELIGECPAEVAEQVADRLTYIMRTAAQDKLSINFKCDPTIEEKWYLSDYVDNIVNHYHEDINKGLSKEESLNKLIAEHTEQTSEFITQLIHDKVKS